MVDILDRLKAQARILHTQAKQADAAAQAGLRVLPEFREADAGQLPESVKRRHCLTAIARELGFHGWPHLVTVVNGEPVEDFGGLLYPPRFSARLNIWCASHDEAARIRAEHGGYLLVFKRQFFIAEEGFIEAFGLDPHDADWERIGRDWARPKDAEARRRLYAKAIDARQQLNMPV
jgi:hypothetical protein